MIDAGSLIGFAVAFVAATWVASALACGALLLAERAPSRRGPQVTRVAAASALVLGPLAGLAVVSALIGHSLQAMAAGGGDHCGAHGHHLHLCLLHGGAWVNETWALTALVGVAGFVVARLVQKVIGAATASRALGRMRRLAAVSPDGVWLLPASSAFCFVAGLVRPAIYVSSSAWDALDDGERAAVLAHERAHLAHGDVWQRTVLGVFALVGAPALAHRVLGRWQHATELVCDHRAARATTPAAVASALLTLVRLGGRPPLAGLSFASPDEVTARVEALLAGRSVGVAVARRVLACSLVGLAVLAAAAVAFADPLHHGIETLLGVL